MSSYRTRSKRAQNEKIKLVLGIVGMGLFILGAVGFVGYQLMQDEVQYHKDNGCPLAKNGEIAPRAHTVILIDETDQLSLQQKDFMDTYLRNFVKNDLKPGELLSIYALGDNVDKNRKPLFEMCKMRDGSDADAFTENEKLMARRFKTKFEEPLNRELIKLMEPRPAANQSPIFEMIQAISVNSFAKHNVDGDRRLIIYSDMLHHTKDFSLYKSTNYSQLRQLAYFGKVSSRLPDIKVYLYVFNNHSEFQQNRLIQFWEKFFADKNASLVYAEPTGR